MKFIAFCIFVAAVSTASGKVAVDSEFSDDDNFVECKSIRYVVWDFIGNQLTCEIRAGIDGTNYKIKNPRNESVTVLFAGQNENINYLPIQISNVFPNLIGLFARNSSIKAIYPTNFMGLNRLKYVHLSMNDIVRIGNDTFEDAGALQWLMLDDNKIEFMHGQALKKLSNLHHVNLYLNECVDEDFDTPELLKELPNAVTHRCGQCEGNVRLSNCEIMAEIHKTQTKSFKNFGNFIDDVTGMHKEHFNIMETYMKHLAPEAISVNSQFTRFNEMIRFAQIYTSYKKHEAQSHNGVSKKLQAEKLELENLNIQLKKDIAMVQTKLQLQKQEVAAKKLLMQKKNEELQAKKALVEALNRKAAELGAHYCSG